MNPRDEYPGDWPPRRRTTFGGQPRFDRYGRFRDEPPRPDPREATAEELGAEPVRNGPEKANHLAYCKQHALGEVPDAGNVLSSLMQDFGEDPRTQDYQDVLQHLMLPLILIGEYDGPGGPDKLRKFILDFG